MMGPSMCLLVRIIWTRTLFEWAVVGIQRRTKGRRGSEGLYIELSMHFHSIFRFGSFGSPSPRALRKSDHCRSMQSQAIPD